MTKVSRLAMAQGHVEHMSAQILLCNYFGRNIPLGWLRSESEILRLGQQVEKQMVRTLPPR
jgi:hypothetical protein